MMKTKQVKKATIQPIKPFQTLEEEAEYWDTQTILDEINEGAAVGFHQANNSKPTPCSYKLRYYAALRSLPSFALTLCST